MHGPHYCPGYTEESRTIKLQLRRNEKMEQLERNTYEEQEGCVRCHFASLQKLELECNPLN
jgi:hypothetical protein